MPKDKHPAPQPDPDETETETSDVEQLADFDAFWSDTHRTRKPKTIRILGRDVVLPNALPLQFELEARKLAKAKAKDRDIAKLVSILFGEDQYHAMCEAGLDMDQFKVLLFYTPRRLAGDTITLAEAYAAVMKAESDEDDTDDPR